MSPAVAAANNEKIQIGFVGKIIPPYVWSNRFSGITDIDSGIHFQLDEIICLNPKTGLRWKVDLEEKKPRASDLQYVKPKPQLKTRPIRKEVEAVSKSANPEDPKHEVQKTIQKIALGLEKKDLSEFYETLSPTVVNDTSPVRLKNISVLRSTTRMEPIFTPAPYILTSGFKYAYIQGSYSVIPPTTTSILSISKLLSAEKRIDILVPLPGVPKKLSSPPNAR